jgi:hypothetical protein
MGYINSIGALRPWNLTRKLTAAARAVGGAKYDMRSTDRYHDAREAVAAITVRV